MLGLDRRPGAALPCLRSWRRGWADGPDPEPLQKFDMSLVGVHWKIIHNVPWHADSMPAQRVTVEPEQPSRSRMVQRKSWFGFYWTAWTGYC